MTRHRLRHSGAGQPPPLPPEPAKTRRSVRPLPKRSRRRRSSAPRRYTLRTTLRRAVRHRDERIPLDLHELATLLGVSDKTVQRKVHPSLEIGSAARFIWGDVEEQLRGRSSLRPAVAAKAKRRSAPTKSRSKARTADGEPDIRSVQYWEDSLEEDS